MTEFDENDNRFGKRWVWAPGHAVRVHARAADPQGGWADMPAAATKRDNLAAARVT